MTNAEPTGMLIPGVSHLSNDSWQKAVYNEKLPVKTNNLLTQFAAQHESMVKPVSLNEDITLNLKQ